MTRRVGGRLGFLRKPDPLLLDLGCGLGGLGRHLSRIHRTDLIGVDISPVAIERAKAWVGTRENSRRAYFRVCDFAAMDLADSSVTVAVSLDALYLAPDAAAALHEIRRVLVPGGGLIFTIYVPVRSASSRTVSTMKWPSLLKDTGFVIDDLRDLTSEWRAVMRRKHEIRWRRQHWLRETLGPRAEPELAVTSAMLGIGVSTSFLETVERFEIEARSS
jgi:SAM-dependent methyltransferase